jgi:acyl-CoA hydrolase
MKGKTCNESRVVRTDLVLPNETNNHNTLFGGVLMKNMDAIASIAARRHCRTEIVTASTDSVDFLYPIRPTDSFFLEAFVTWTGTTSMEVFVKAVAEDFDTEERKIAATAFLTFVSIGSTKENPVPFIIPETDEEVKLHETGKERAEERKKRRKKSKELASFITTSAPWE